MAEPKSNESLKVDIDELEIKIQDEKMWIDHSIEDMRKSFKSQLNVITGEITH